MTAISTGALHGMMALSIQRARAALTTAQTEASTGQHADLGLALGARSGEELSIRNETSVLNEIVASNALAGVRLTATQNALDAMRSGAQNMLQTLTSGASPGPEIGALGSDALGALTSAVNTTAAGEYVFGGINAGVAPLADYFAKGGSTAKSAVDASFVATFGMTPADAKTTTITGAQMTAFLDGPFARLFDDGGWTSNWSAAANVNKTANIAPGSHIQMPANANQPGVRSLTRAYAMLSTLGGAALGDDARRALAAKASSLIGSGLADLTSMGAAIGSTQARIGDATDEVHATLALLQSRQTDLDGVDQYKAASTVSALTTQIQAAYEITAQLQQLSLVKYLPT